MVAQADLLVGYLTTLAAAGLAGLAAAGLVPGRRNRLDSTGSARASGVPASSRWSRGRPRGLRGLLLGRPDGPTLGFRAIIGSAAAAAVALAAAGGGPGWRLAGLTGAAVVMMAVVAVLGGLQSRHALRRVEELRIQTPLALEMLACALAAGLPPRNATLAVAEIFPGPVGEDLAAVLAGVEVGMSDALAWRTLRDHPTFGPAAVDFARSVESGTMLAETLLHHARNGRLARQSEIEASAKAVGVRCVLPLMLCFLPAFLLLGVVPTVVSAFLANMPAELGGP